MKILFVTRKYPPSVGGMETAAAALYAELSHRHDVRLIKWGGSNRWLPIVYPWLAMRSLVACWLRGPDVVYIQDGVMAPIGRLVQMLGRRPTVMTIHGLEVTFRNQSYRRVVLPAIARQDRLVAVSAATAAAVQAATDRDDVAVITNGVADVHYGNGTRDLPDQLAHLTARPLLYTSGRLVARKGAAWFATEVLPLVAEQIPGVVYVVSGSGDQSDNVTQIAADSEHVEYLGRVDDATRDALYRAADLFVMPNQPVTGDMEGFGLVAVEAGSCGTPVVASALEGITDAVQEGTTGFLVDPADPVAFAARVTSELGSPTMSRQDVRAAVLDRYSWTAAAKQYEEVLRSSVALRA